jgi:very-short-patch-repair endonuclease
MSNQIPKPVMQRLAKNLRSSQSTPETLLWKILRDRRIHMKFRRQMPIGNFIIDFVCMRQRLIVELDGPHHETVEQKISDARRELWLKQQAFRVLRITTDEMMGDSELATQKIIAALALPVPKRER